MASNQTVKKSVTEQEMDTSILYTIGTLRIFLRAYDCYSNMICVSVLSRHRSARLFGIEGKPVDLGRPERPFPLMGQLYHRYSVYRSAIQLLHSHHFVVLLHLEGSSW